MKEFSGQKPRSVSWLQAIKLLITQWNTVDEEVGSITHAQHTVISEVVGVILSGTEMLAEKDS